MHPLRIALCHVALWIFSGCFPAWGQAEYSFTADQGHSVLEADPSRPGFIWRIHQIPQIPGFYGYRSFEVAEGQLEGTLGPNIADPANVGSADGPALVPADPNRRIEFHIPRIISLLPWAGFIDGNGMVGDGNFLFHDAMPGVTREQGWTVGEAEFWIELPQGTTTLGLAAHGGVRWTMGGTAPADTLATRVLNPMTTGSTFDETLDPNRTFRVTVPTAGLYPARVLMPMGDGMLLELYSVDSAGNLVLLNDAATHGLRTFSALLSPDPAAVVNTIPVNGTNATEPSPAIEVTLQGSGIQEDGSLLLRVDGVPVPYSISHTADRTTLHCTQPVHFDSESRHTAEVVYNDGQPRSAVWQWTTRFYQTLTPEMAVNPDTSKPGFHLRLMFNPKSVDFDPTGVDRALEGLLTDMDGAPVENRADPTIIGAALAPGVPEGSGPNPSLAWDLPGSPNWMAADQVASNPLGIDSGFPPQEPLPGFPPASSYPPPTAAGELITYITLPKGSFRLGASAWSVLTIESGDVFNSTTRKRVSVINASNASPLGTQAFEVQEPGTYPFRFSWGGPDGTRLLILFAYADDGSRILLNTPGRAGSFRCYRAKLDPPDPGPRIVVNSPIRDYAGNLTPESVSATLADGVRSVDLSSIHMSVQGSQVTPEIRKTGSRTTVMWSGNQDLAPSTKVPIQLDFQDDAGGHHHTEWSFTTPVFTRDTRFIEAEQMNTVGGVSVPEWLGYTFPRPASDPVMFTSLAARAGLDWNFRDLYGRMLWPSPNSEVTFPSHYVFQQYGDRGFYTQTNGLSLSWERPGNWFQYTRRFPAGANRYQLFVQAASGTANVDLEISRVVSGAFTGNGVTERLGYVSPEERTGNLFVMKVFPVTASLGPGEPVTVTIPGGLQTLRVTLRSGNTAVDWIALRPCQECFADQTIDFAPIADGSVRAFDSRTFTATASSGLPVTISVTSGPCFAAGGNFLFQGVGATTLTATQSGSSQYRPAKPVSRTFLVAKVPQTIQFPTVPETAHQPSGTSIPLAAFVTARLPIAYSVVSGPATVAGNILRSTGAGIVVVEATQSGSTLYEPAAPVRQTLRILPTPQKIQFTPPTGVEFAPGKQLILDATSDSGLPVTISLTSGPGILSDHTLTLTGTGNLLFTATQIGDDNVAPAPAVQRTITVSRSAQFLTFPPLGTVEYATGLSVPLAARSSSGLAVFYSIVSGPGTLFGDSLVITGAGTIQVVASQSGDANFLTAAPVAQILTVRAQSQTLNFSLPETAEFSIGLSFPLNATASSGLPVSYAVLGDTASIQDGRLVIANVGTVTVTASQPGNGSVSAAPLVNRTIHIAPGSQSLDFPLPLQVLYTPGVHVTLRATASSGLPVSFSVIQGPAFVQDDQLVFTGIGTATVEARQSGDVRFLAAAPVSRSILASATTQVLDFPEITPIEFAPGLILPLIARASSGLPVSFQVTDGPGTLADGRITVTGAGTITVVASQPGSDGYLAAAPVTRRLVVTRGPQTLTFDPVSDLPFSVGLTLPLNGSASSGLPVSFAIVDGPGTIQDRKLSISSVGMVTLTVSQPGNADFLPAAPLTRTLTIRRGNQAILFPPLASLEFQPGRTLRLDASSESGLPVQFRLESGPGVLVGQVLTINNPGEFQLTATQDGDDHFLPATAVTRTLQVRRATQSLALEPLDPQTYAPGKIVNLRGSSSSGLPVTYTLVSGLARLSGDALTLLGAGQVTVTIDQPGNEQVAPATPLTRVLAIGKGSQSIAFPAPSDPVLGGPAVSLSAVATSGLPVAFAVVSGPASLDGATLRAYGSGPIQLSATQDGDGNFMPATPVLLQLTARPGLTLQMTERNGAASVTLELRLDLGTTSIVEETDTLGRWHEIFRAFGLGPNFPVYVPVAPPDGTVEGRFWRVRMIP